MAEFRLRDWAGLPIEMLECISKRLDEPKDFLSFRAVCSPWREAVQRDAHARFHPWIIKSDEVGVDGKVMFYCMSAKKFLEIHVPALQGRKWWLVGYGAGHLIAIDNNDGRSAVLVNPLTGESTTLPPLPEGFLRACWIAGFATDPELTGEDDVFVVMYKLRPIDRLDNVVAMWRLGSGDAGWAITPFRKFWPAMPLLRRRLAEHGPWALEEEAAADGEDGLADAGHGLGEGVEDAQLMEREGHVRLLVRLLLREDDNWLPWEEDDNWLPFPWPRVSFTLMDMIGDNLEHVEWADVPELHDKIILQSWHGSCYVLLDDFVGLGSKNCVYYFSWQHLEDGKAAEYCICKWDFLERVSTIVMKMPGVWYLASGRWFLPTLK